MTYEFILPDIGEGVAEAEIQKWFVKTGDEVHEDEPLVEVMTDKATVTIPSPRRGRVTKLHYGEGDLAKVHQPLLEMELVEAGNGATAKGPERAVVPAPRLEDEPRSTRRNGDERPTTPIPVVPVGPGDERRKPLATPAVRAMAREHGIDLGEIVGTGPGGRITKVDLEQARSYRGPVVAPRVATRSEHGGQVVAMPLHHDPASIPDDIVPFRGVRRRIAERLALSKRTAAHFTFVEQADVTELVKVRNRIAAAASEEGVKLTFLPFVVKAAVAALKKHPWLNATLDEERGEIRLRREYHIGIASATEQGLMVPVLHHADRLSLLDVARELDRLAIESKSGKAKPEDLRGSTFSITSLGAIGGLFATPIINFPEVAVLGIHRIRPTPLVKDGEIVARDVMYVSLSFDHRVVDGDVAAGFAYELIRYLEEPNLLFMRMV